MNKKFSRRTAIKSFAGSTAAVGITLNAKSLAGATEEKKKQAEG
jgi:hypothetical protein